MTNRLVDETSPYLRQHAHDPVDWYPWGEEAFRAARSRGKPIFLSIGYASCHWCHVMHRESFSDPAVAELLNRDFVSIKVDRESRPDVDELYMAYVVASTGRGGWPMSVFLNEDLVPVYGGTYFPPSQGLGMPSFPSVLDAVSTAFAERPAEVADSARDSLSYLEAMFAPVSPAPLDADVLHRAARVLLSSADPQFGGFGAAPKFPQAPVTDFLLAYYGLTGDERVLDAVQHAISGMLRGGIYDQAGGGIARYAVDREWLVPHFEKMLYDNAQFLSTLAALQAVDPSDEWAHAARHTFAFLERDLLLPNGAYASSLDADTEGREGATYVWRYEDLESLLTPDQLTLATDRLGVTQGGNWEGTTILTRRGGRTADAEEVDAVLDRLLEARSERPQPQRDDKAIVSWNALAARGLIEAGEVFDDRPMLERGLALTRLLLDRAVTADHGVRRLLDDPASGAVRTLEDAAALVLAALTAARVAGEPAMHERALEILRKAADVFYDDSGTWYLVPTDTELPVRARERHDGATPSGASLAALAAVRIGASSDEWTGIARATLERMVPAIGDSPFSGGTVLHAVLELLSRNDS